MGVGGGDQARPLKNEFVLAAGQIGQNERQEFLGAGRSDFTAPRATHAPRVRLVVGRAHKRGPEGLERANALFVKKLFGKHKTGGHTGHVNDREFGRAARGAGQKPSVTQHVERVENFTLFVGGRPHDDRQARRGRFEVGGELLELTVEGNPKVGHLRPGVQGRTRDAVRGSHHQNGAARVRPLGGLQDQAHVSGHIAGHGVGLSQIGEKFLRHEGLPSRKKKR